MPAGGAHLVAFANEKGGSGKSTLAVHVAIAAAKAGYRVAALDLDFRQRSFARYMDNRAETAAAQGLDLASVYTRTFVPTGPFNIVEQLDDLGADFDLVIADTPGRDDMATLATIGRSDLLVTPINDSFLDFDLIGQVDPATFQLVRPSFYTRLVWELRAVKAKMGRNLDWVVVRNRLQHLQARNMRRVADALEALAPRAGFRVAPGLGERVAFRELFPSGLTILDVDEAAASPSMLNAQREIASMVEALRLPPAGTRPRRGADVAAGDAQQ